MKDNINPDHYKNQTSLECIEAMIIIFGYQKVIDFCLLNAWKYIWRWKNKNGTEDLDKANWYIERGMSLNPDYYDERLFKRIATYIESEIKALEESFEAEDKEYGTMEERLNTINEEENE